MSNAQLSMKTIMLIITESCNLNCSYCYEHHKSESKMTFETAKSILDKELSDTNYERFMIQLFGGEPFLNVDLIKQIDDYLFDNFKETRYHIFICTNGTLISSQMEEWLIERKNRITVGVSLDGTKDMHDINRSNSFNNINLNFFLANYPEQTCKMTISEETLPYMADGIIYLTELGFRVSPSFALGIKYFKDNISVVEEQFKKLADYYIANPQYTVCDLLDANLHLLASNDSKGDKWCGCGKDLVAYDHNGDKYPCQLFAPISLGKDSYLFKNKDEAYMKTLGDFRDETCIGCMFKPICPTCCGMSWLTKNSLSKHDETICLFTKMRFQYAAYFLYKKIFQNRNTTEKLTQYEYDLLVAIQKIIDYFEEHPIIK